MSRFLFITQLYPSGLSGTSVKTRKTIEYLLQKKHAVDVICIHHNSLVRPENWQHPQLRIFVVSKSVMSHFSISYVLKHLPLLFSATPFRVKKMFSERLLQTIITLFESELYHRVFFDGFAMLQYATHLLERQFDQESGEHLSHNFLKKRWIYIDDEDITDLMRQRARSERNPIQGCFFWSEYLKASWYEKRVMSLVNEIWAISPRTAARLKTVSTAKVWVMPTPVVKRKFAFQIKSRDLMFTGLLSWLENIIGLEWFLDTAWPKILQQYPRTKLYVVGQMAKPNFIAKLKTYPNVVYKGFVPDLQTLYQKTAVAIAPILINCGIKVKVVTYLSYGLPVVSTVAAAWGLQQFWGVSTADSGGAFASRVIELLANDSVRQKAAKQAFKNARQFHSDKSLELFLKKVKV